jgi:hypothetical protein
MMTRLATNLPLRSRRASVLVIVLVTLLFASAAVVAFVEKAGDDLIVESREAAGKRLRREAYSALEVTLAVLEDFRLVNGGLRSPAEGWNDPLTFAGWAPREGCTAEVTFDDESGKISLPHAEVATLLNLFQGWGLTQTNAERLSDVLLEWMKKDHVSTSLHTSEYDRGALPYAPPLRSLRSFSELAAIDYAREIFYDKDGRPNERYQQFVNTFSLFDFKQTNLNGGRQDALSALGSLDPSQRRQLSEYLEGTGERAHQGPSFFDSPAQAANLLGSGKVPESYGAQISALRVNVTIHEGRTSFRLSAVVSPAGGATVVPPAAPRTKANAVGGPPVDPATTAQAKPAPAKKLNYPFTLLEIRENAEISPVPVPSTKA